MIKHLYIHIPFCSYKCPYCDFFSITGGFEKEFYLKALIKELSLYSSLSFDLETLYFGGGTPSFLSIKDWEFLFNAFEEFFDTKKVKEITIEVNPKDYSSFEFQKLLNLGFNRVSIGAQSFSEKKLKNLGRAHSVKDTLETIKSAKIAGFCNISIDIIWGVFEESLEDLKRDLDNFLNLELPHGSFYQLTYYKETPIYKNKEKALEEEKIALMYELLISSLKSYNHYEISNWAKKGFESLHNMAYWEYKDFLGIGLSSSSKISPFLFKNTKSFDHYYKSLEQGKLPIESFNILTQSEEIKNKIMMNLRTKKGSSEITFVKPFLKEFLEEKDGFISIKEDYFLISNEIISYFI